MIIIRNVILVLILVICTYLGINKSKEFHKREIELKKIKSALNIFKTKINYTYETIGDIFKEISKLEYQDRKNIFSQTINLLENGDLNKAWEKAMSENNIGISEEDKEILKMLGKTLGKTDKEGQISEIELVSNFLNKQISLAEEIRTKNEKMYKTLGVTIGLAIVIILV